MLYSFVNLSSEGFIFFIEGIYLSIIIIVLNNIYLTKNNDNIYVQSKNVYYEHIFIISFLFKSLNIKSCIQYRCFH